MKNHFGRALKSLFCAIALFASPVGAKAQWATTADQSPVPFAVPGSSPAEVLLQNYSVPGGKLYVSVLRALGVDGPVLGLAQSFVPSSSGGLTRYLALTGAKSDLGVPMTATAGTPTGTVGVARTAGTSLNLVGEATSSSAKTDKALFEFDLPDSYVAGANIAVTVNCGATGGTITAASTTMTVAADTEINGAEAALTVSAAQQIPSSPGNLTFTITGTALTPGAHLTLELTMLVTTSAGAGTGTIYSVAYGA
jgi:hypothetical protein